MNGEVVRETEKLRSLVRYYYREAVANSATLLATIESAHTALVELNVSGRITTGIAGGGISKSFATDRTFTPNELEGMVGRLLDLYDESRAALVSGGTTSPTDLQIRNEMLLRCTVPHEIEEDYSSLRALS